ncbi:MAG: hypothetical protein IKP58_17005 [Victivallales bacterium]|nr:hypothetical protein [Victivallales bacterium]
MSEYIKANDNYTQWLKELKARYQAAKIKALVTVNREMLMSYRNLVNASINFPQAVGKMEHPEIYSLLMDKSSGRKKTYHFPEEYKGSLPTIEEIEAELKED